MRTGCLCRRQDGIPTIVHEQNSLPGITNKFLSKYVNKVAICFEEAKSHFPSEKVVFTGNPRASEVVSIETGRSMAEFGLSEEKNGLNLRRKQRRRTD